MRATRFLGVRRQPHLERLEERHVLSGSPIDLAPLGDLTADWSAYNTTVYTSPPPPPPETLNLGGGGSLLPIAPFPLEQTFLLHSLPGATKTIYLDFDGHLTRDTPWNTGFDIPNILTPAFSMDANFAAFSDIELLTIQQIWERVAEDFRPFHVNVTTQDPGIEALRKTAPVDPEIDPEDLFWGQRVVIGGSTNDWYTPVDGTAVGGVAHGSFNWDIDDPTFAFGQDFLMGNTVKNIAEVISHETGHTLGLAHDGQYRFYMDISEDPPEWTRLEVEYYPGHGGGPSGWAPIMGVGYGQELTQWSKGEYFNANNTQGDLEIITGNNGFDYREDDHGGATDTATILESDIDEVTWFGEGIIERNTDVDYFSFTVEGLGEILSFDIRPFYSGPNLDILAKLYDSSGAVIATSNPEFDLNSSFTDVSLLPGTYYISIEGAGRPIAFLDPAVHPGPLEWDPEGEEPLPPDTSDWGYSNYGSLGYFSIQGVRKKGLVVGVDFDAEGGTSPLNWNLYSGGGPQTVLTNLISETGGMTPYRLSISTTGEAVETSASSNPISSADLPNHALPLNGLDGYLAAEDETLTFVWSNLEPASVYQVYVFGHADTEMRNVVNVLGGIWNGQVQTFDFTQDVAADGLVVNDEPEPGGKQLSTLSLLVISSATGEITITINNEEGHQLGLGGLAIAPTKFGTINGQKWNDADGDRTKDPGEEGLPGWLIYLDLNNNGVLDVFTSPDQQVVEVAPNVPQTLVDYSTVKNEVDVTTVGEITDLDVTVDLSHTFPADLELYLISPLGTRIKLMDDVGGAGQPGPAPHDDFGELVFDDSSTRPITSLVANEAPFNGRFRPMQPLSAFNGESSNGKWTLEITDDAAGDVGVLNSWSMTFTLRGVEIRLEPAAVTDESGNYSFPNLLPGVYQVREEFNAQQQLEGWRQSWAPPPVTVRSGAQVMDIDFGNWVPVVQRGSIAGQKWNDLNNDGVQDPDEPGLGGWIVYMDANNNGVRDIATTPTTIAAADTPKEIADFSTVNSQVTFDGLGTVLKVEVTLDITHSFMADLDAFLISPTGRVVELFTGVGGQFNNFEDLTLADDASRSIATIGFNDLPYTGRWQPEGFLSDFIGDDAAGVWTLLVRDTAFADEGMLNSWSLTITAGELFTTTDEDGSYRFENLPPGEYLIREQQRPGWAQSTPDVTIIPGAVWENGGWLVTIVGQDDPFDPNGPDSQRNVKNVDFGNYALGPVVPPLLGDYNGDGKVDNGDFVIWRRTSNTAVEPYSGADGNGDGTIDGLDYDVWRANFGQSLPLGGSGELATAATSTEVLLAESVALAVTADFAHSDIAFAPGSAVLEHDARALIGASTLQPGLPPAASTAVVTSPLRHRPQPHHERFFEASDAGLLAWLHARRGDLPSLPHLGRNGNSSPDEAAGDSGAEALELLDQVFEALGASVA